MNKGDILELTIVSYGMDGEGVAKLDNYVIFVPGCLIGEKVKVQVVEVKKAFARAKIIKVLEPSKERIQPLCPVYFRCGGCEMQHVNYEYQLKVKRDNIKNCIDRACKIDCKVDEVVTGEKKFGYRNKVQIPLRMVNGKVCAGFYKTGSHTFIPFEKREDDVLGDCPLHTRAMQKIVDAVIEYANENKISTYNEEKNIGILRHLVLRRVDNSYSICIVVNANSLPKNKELIKKLEQLKISFSLYVSINQKRTNVIMGDKLSCLYGEEKVKGNALGVEFFVNPNSFMQINDEIRDKIYTAVCDEISKTEEAKVADVYSGIGIISNIVASKASKVVGIEIVKEAIEDANKIAKMNSHNNILNVCGDAAVELPRVINEFKGENSIVVIDPPRKGCDNKVLESILDSEPGKVIYISCNPATLARDLSLLINKYNIAKITPYDMFPQTTHVETVCLLSKLHEAKHHVNVTVDMDEMDLTAAESKATYEGIKKYVVEHNDGMKVTNLYIAQVKAKYGIIERENFNLPKSGYSKQLQCPKEKEAAIVEAFKAFKMI